MSNRAWSNVKDWGGVRKFARSQAWSSPHSYTVTWTSESGTPFQGTDGTLSGTFMRNDHFCIAKVIMEYGSAGSPSTGTGIWSFSLPVTPVFQPWYGAGELRDATTALFNCTAIIEGGILRAQSHNTATRVGATVPFAWAVDDFVRLSVMYPI